MFAYLYKLQTKLFSQAVEVFDGSHLGTGGLRLW